MTPGIESVAAQRLLDHATQQHSPATEQLSQRFDQLMAHDAHATDHNLSNNNRRDTPATEFVGKGEAVMRETFRSMQSFMAEAPHLDMRQLAVRHVDMTMQIAVTQFHLSACAHVAQSGKNGMQTLMKNQ